MTSSWLIKYVIPPMRELHHERVITNTKEGAISFVESLNINPIKIMTAEKLEASYMKKYLAWAESESNSELWFLVDAESQGDAEDMVLSEEDVIEVRACLEVAPNNIPGISHRFILNE